MARSKRQATPGDMVRTLLVILLPLGVIVALFTSGPRDYPVKTVDWQPVLAEARAESPYPVLAPVGLPATWRATSVSWLRPGEGGLNGAPSERNEWSLGFLAPDDVYVGLRQGDTRPQPLIDDVTRQGRADGESVVGDRTWTRYLSSDGRTYSLVLAGDAVTTIVVSDGGYDLLQAYASTLQS